MPSPFKLTKEAIQWMQHDKYMSTVICNALGLRKLTEEELELLPKDNMHLGCFFTKSGQPLDTKSTAICFGKDVATFGNFAEIKDKEMLQFALDNRNVLFLNYTSLVTKNWVPYRWFKIHDNFFIKSNGPRFLGEVLTKCEDVFSKQLIDFLKKGNFVILIHMMLQNMKNILATIPNMNFII